MSFKQDEWLHNHDNFDSESHDKEKGDYYNMNIAAFTFGGKKDKSGGQQMPLGRALHENDQMETNSNFKKQREKRRCEEEEPKTTLVDDICAGDNVVSPIINKIGAHNSFLSVVVHSLWHMKKFRNYILKDLSDVKNVKNKILYDLRNVFSKYSQGNRKVDITKLRLSLADLFQNRRKFLIDQPDDPIDCYFAFLNAVHSNSICSSLNEVVDATCGSKCISHTNFWIDLSRVNECECKGQSRRLFSNHHYIFDIPLDKLFDLCNQINLVEMTKSFKLRSGKLSQVGSSEISGVTDLKGKLFLYFKMLINQSKANCPAKGQRCEINQTRASFQLANLPSYLTFSLSRAGGERNVVEILKTIILIPRIFDLSALFDHQAKEKVFYEFFGAVLQKESSTHTCFFRGGPQQKEHDLVWTHYDDEKVTLFNSWFDLISFCLKNGETPVMVFYRVQDKYAESGKEISSEEMQVLDRYARNADNLCNIKQNRFRTNEDIIKFERPTPNDCENFSFQANKPNSSKSSTCIASSKNTSHNNSQVKLDEYPCAQCGIKNRIESPLCYRCGKNNENVIEELLKKKSMNNYINIANFNLNINTSEKKNPQDCERASMGSKAGSIKNAARPGEGNPFKKQDVASSYEEELSFKEKNKSKSTLTLDHNMPKQMVVKKESPVMIRPAEQKEISQLHNTASKKDLNSNLISPHKQRNTKMNTIEEKNDRCEDRIRPFAVSKPKAKPEKKATQLDKWVCEHCSVINRSLEYKCKECKKVNQRQLAHLEKYATSCRKVEDKERLRPRPSSLHPEKAKTPQKDKSPHTPDLDRKRSEKKFSNNYLTSPNEAHNSSIKKSCLCYSNYNESVIKNNICAICNRHVDGRSLLEKTIKKKYVIEPNSSRPSNPGLKANKSFKGLRSEVAIKREDSSHILKKRSPSNYGSKVNTHNRYKDIQLNDDDMLSPNINANPFLGNVRNSKPTIQPGDNGRASSNARLNATIKKRSEPTGGHNKFRK